MFEIVEIVLSFLPLTGDMKPRRLVKRSSSVVNYLGEHDDLTRPLSLRLTPRYHFALTF